MIAEKIQEALKLPFKLDGHELYITASIGIVMSMVGYDHPEEVLRDADIAMYQAKALGKARFEIFDITDAFPGVFPPGNGAGVACGAGKPGVPALLPAHRIHEIRSGGQF